MPEETTDQTISEEIRENVERWLEYADEVDRLKARLLRMRGGNDQKRKIRKHLNVVADLAGEAASVAEKQLR